jgi:UDPglucose 6-dehydrogenase
MVDLAREELGGNVEGKRIAVLGLAFKPNSDDVRDSPALDVAVALAAEGAIVTATDPEAIATSRRLHPELTFASTAAEAAKGAEAVLVLTEWTDYTELVPADLGSIVSERLIIDGRNCLDPAEWRAADWTYRALGRG